MAPPPSPAGWQPVRTGKWRSRSSSTASGARPRAAPSRTNWPRPSPPTPRPRRPGRSPGCWGERLTTELLPMFPLQTVLFPGVAMPLHVFEPRYRALTRHCLDGDGRFGVVLIERGSEVGGGDVRVSVGTGARIVESAELPDGRWLLMVVGVERVGVRRWLPDDPYPQAEVDVLAEAQAGQDAEA